MDRARGAFDVHLAPLDLDTRGDSALAHALPEEIFADSDEADDREPCIKRARVDGGRDPT